MTDDISMSVVSRAVESSALTLADLELALGQMKAVLPEDEVIMVQAARDVLLEWSRRGGRIHALEAEITALTPDAKLGAMLNELSKEAAKKKSTILIEYAPSLPKPWRVLGDFDATGRAEVFGAGDTPEAALRDAGLDDEVGE